MTPVRSPSPWKSIQFQIHCGLSYHLHRWLEILGFFLHCHIYHALIFTPPQKIVCGESLQSPIWYFWISLRCLNQDAICKVLQTFGFLLSHSLQMPACNCGFFQHTIPAIQQILQHVIILASSSRSTLHIRNGLISQTPLQSIAFFPPADRIEKWNQAIRKPCHQMTEAWEMAVLSYADDPLHLMNRYRMTHLLTHGWCFLCVYLSIANPSTSSSLFASPHTHLPSCAPSTFDDASHPGSSHLSQLLTNPMTPETLTWVAPSPTCLDISGTSPPPLMKTIYASTFVPPQQNSPVNEKTHPWFAVFC